MIWADLAIGLGLGAAGSLHCAQMCGPIVLGYSMSGKTSAIAPHLFYNAGRISTYSLLGLAAGAVGNQAGRLAELAGAGKWFGVAFGLLLIAVGFMMLHLIPQGGLLNIGQKTWSERLMRPVTRLLVSTHKYSKLLLGLGMGLLPCGLIYAALVKAASTESPLAGLATMAGFGLGTSGTLLAIGGFSSQIRFRLGSWSRYASVAPVVLLGLFVILRSITAPAVAAAGGCGHVH